MDIIPAIDLSEGRCVRLRRGDMARKTIYSDNPAEFARRWEDEGAHILHVVDLDGAVAGGSRNLAAIDSIVAAVGIPVELGGGLRTIEDVGRALEAGVRWAIMGTSALRDRPAVEAAVTAFGGRIIIGIDARDGLVAVDGWVKSSDVTAVELARRMDVLDIAKIIFTDISTDGMMSGPNVESTRALAEAVSTPVIASGGVTTLDDVKAVCAIAPAGVTGMIIGRALYEGTISLPEAIRTAADARR